jgi:hypothetical protein
VDQQVADKIRELRHLIEHATEDDRCKVAEMNGWFDEYLARATPSQAKVLRSAMRRLWPTGQVVLMEIAESVDPDVAASAIRDLEMLRSRLGEEAN